MDKYPVMVMTEHMPKGSLVQFLKAGAPGAATPAIGVSGLAEDPIQVQDLFDIAIQVGDMKACGTFVLACSAT